MDSVESYLAEILAVISPLPPAELGLADADGAVLADDITAQWPLPSFDNSAMDGYAVLAGDLAGASTRAPVVLPVAADVAAGDTSQVALTPGTCISITTGAPLPAGADAIVPVERTEQLPAGVSFSQPAAPGAYIRRVGDDAQPGDLLLPAGVQLGPAQLGLLAAAGRASVPARPRPRVTVIPTGNELTEPGRPLVPGLIWESNSWMLAAAARQAGATARRHPVVADDTDGVLAAVQEAIADADLLITSGGVSMGGEHDAVKAALSKLGTVSFRKVAMHPGMPQGFGVVGPGQTPIFTLPGNPVSAFVSFRMFVAPALRQLQGLHSKRETPLHAVLAGPVRSPAGRRSFLRGRLDREAGTVAPVSGQSSHQLASLARADALIIVPEHVTELAAGQDVDVLELP
jgi:molybdopterin molybdotransferase